MRNCITKKVQTIGYDANNDQNASLTPQTVENDEVCPSAPTMNSTFASNQQLLQLMKAALATASEAVAATSGTSLQDFEEMVSIAECLLNTLKTASRHTTHTDNSTASVHNASTMMTLTPQTYTHVAAMETLLARHNTKPSQQMAIHPCKKKMKMKVNPLPSVNEPEPHPSMCLILCFPKPPQRQLHLYQLQEAINTALPDCTRVAGVNYSQLGHIMLYPQATCTAALL